MHSVCVRAYESLHSFPSFLFFFILLLLFLNQMNTIKFGGIQKRMIKQVSLLLRPSIGKSSKAIVALMRSVAENIIFLRLQHHVGCVMYFCLDSLQSDCVHYVLFCFLQYLSGQSFMTSGIQFLLLSDGNYNFFLCERSCCLLTYFLFIGDGCVSIINQTRFYLKIRIFRVENRF